MAKDSIIRKIIYSEQIPKSPENSNYMSSTVFVYSHIHLLNENSTLYFLLKACYLTVPYWPNCFRTLFFVKKTSSILFDELFFPQKKFIICCTSNRVKSTNITYRGVY